jgi:tetratricopeptide (TPR) repeat protein
MIAKCLDTLGRKSAARSEYIKARDFDQLRFRTSSDFNNAISSVCNGDNMMFVDIEHAFQNQSPDSLIGHNLIVEHLHPNSSGFFLMAKEYARVLRERGLIAPAKEWKEKDTIRDEVFWERRSVTEIDELVAKRRTEILTAGWPFTNHIPVVTAVAAGDTLGGIVEEMTRGRMDWQQAHLLTVEYYASRGETDKVEKEYRLLINQIPYEITPYLKLARILLDKNEITEVRKLLLSSLELAKTILAYRALGDIALREGKPQEAISWYEGMSVFNQAPREQIENGYLLSVAYAEAGKLDKASMELLKVLQLKPDYQPAAALLAKIKAKK